LLELVLQNRITRSTYSYNEEGRLSGFIDYTPEGTVYRSGEYVYDLDNGRLEYYQYDAEMNLTSTRTDLYNTDLYLIERLYYIIINSKIVPDFNNEIEEKYPEFSLEPHLEL